VLFFWDMNDSKSLGNWFPTIPGDALHLQHSSSPNTSSSYASTPFQNHDILFKHQELITQQCSITPQKTTTPPQKPPDSRAAQHVLNEV
jgi:hypothetical protein